MACSENATKIFQTSNIFSHPKGWFLKKLSVGQLLIKKENKKEKTGRS